MNYLSILKKIIKMNIKNDIGPKMMQKSFIVGILQSFVVSNIFEETKPNNNQSSIAIIDLYIFYKYNKKAWIIIPKLFIINLFNLFLDYLLAIIS